MSVFHIALITLIAFTVHCYGGCHKCVERCEEEIRACDRNCRASVDRYQCDRPRDGGLGDRLDQIDRCAARNSISAPLRNLKDCYVECLREDLPSGSVISRASLLEVPEMPKFMNESQSSISLLQQGSCYCQTCFNTQVCEDNCFATGGNCFCDDLCEGFGDCCPDVCAACGHDCGGPSCFPATAKVSMADGEVKNLKDLKIGDKVLTLKEDSDGEVVATDFYGFGFVLPEEEMFRFVVIEYADEFDVTGSVELTGEHFIYRGKTKECNPTSVSPVEAKLVKPGDYLWTQQSDKTFGTSLVISVRPSINRGKLSPLTMSGTLIIDGTLVSCFDDPTGLGLSHTFWQTISFPVRVAYMLADATGVLYLREIGAQSALLCGHVVTKVCDIVRFSDVWNQVSVFVMAITLAASFKTYKSML